MTEATRRNDPGEEERLKEALFGQELAQLRDLVERFGDDAAVAESVRRVIVDVLRKAGVQDHDRVAEALAPLVVETVAQEIPRQRTRIVQTLMPSARRLFAAGAGGFITGVAQGIDAVGSPLVWVQRVMALSSGRPLEVVRMSTPLWLEGAVLVHDASNTVVYSDYSDQWTDRLHEYGAGQKLPSGETSLTQDAGASIWTLSDNGLTWVVTAYGREGGDIGDGLKDILKETNAHWADALGQLEEERAGPALSASLARDLAGRCRAAFGVAPGDPVRKPRPWFGYAVLVGLVGGLLGWGGWLVWQGQQEKAVLASAEMALDADDKLADLPLSLSYDASGERIIVRGVVSDRTLAGKVEDQLSKAMPDKAIDVLLIAPPPAPDRAQARPPNGELEDQVKALFARINAMQRQYGATVVQAWFGQQSIQFDSGTDYKDSALVAEQIKALAQVFEDWPPEFHLRVVGYSDATGSERSQEKIALERALTVVDGLIAAGVPRDRLAAVGRGASKPISFVHGDGSLNRRVEFEVYTPPGGGG